MNKPYFLIIGTAKSGTTSLYFYLQQHPEIFLPFNKEPFFFAFENMDMTKYRFFGNMKGVKEAITDYKDYQKLFTDLKPGVKSGEASTLYLYEPKASERIHHHLPDVKLIVVLRNPVDRAYSHFQHFRREGYEPIDDFYDAICAEPTRMEDNWFPSYYYLDAGFYSKQLNRYYELFPKSQVKIFLYEDLKNADEMIRQIFDFLDVKPMTLRDTTSRHNISGTIRNPGLYHFVKESTRIKPFVRKLIPASIWSRFRGFWENAIKSPPEPIAGVYRERLIEIYREEIFELQDLIERDLSGWLN